MFSLENDPDIETDAKAHEYLGDIPNIWDNGRDRK
jgi:hypothetical protein